MKGTKAVNLLQVPVQSGNRGKKTIKLMKWALNFMTCWWDKNYYEDSAFPGGERFLEHHLDPDTITNFKESLKCCLKKTLKFKPSEIF